MKFKIMFNDLSKKKQHEFLKLAGLKSSEESDFKTRPITAINVEPFQTIEEFHKMIKEL